VGHTEDIPVGHYTVSFLIITTRVTILTYVHPQVCEECVGHTEDIPVGHYAAAVGHLACLQVLAKKDPYALLTFDKANRSTLFYACANAR
jgi:hypothetical protein